MSPHLLWFPDGTHHGHYEAPDAGAVARGVCRGSIIQLKKIYLANYCNLWNYHCIVVKLRLI